MTMPGPPPKHPSARARRNKVTTHAVLRADHAIVAPELPGETWHPMTVAWWRDVWASPMAPEFDESDRHGLFVLAALVDDFWNAPTAKDRKELAAELRQQGQRFGLSPIDRRRLQWEVERVEAAQADGRRRQSATTPRPKKKPARDPRDILRSV
jgi:hypothetical protein